MRDAGARGRGQGAKPGFRADSSATNSNLRGGRRHMAAQPRRRRRARKWPVGMGSFHEGTVVCPVAACSSEWDACGPAACSPVDVALLHHSPMVPLFIMHSRATRDPAISRPGNPHGLCAELWPSRYRYRGTPLHDVSCRLPCRVLTPHAISQWHRRSTFLSRPSIQQRDVKSVVLGR